MQQKHNNITSFIRSLYPGKAEVHLHEPVFFGNEKKYLEECIDSTFVSSVGPFIKKFEDKFAEYTGAGHAVAVVNGAAALHMALKVLGVNAGDEVITQPLSFVATANAIAYTGAQPVFLDVDKDTLGLSPEALRKWLEQNVELKRCRMSGVSFPTTYNLQPTTEIRKKSLCAYNKKTGRRISACVPMHTFGIPCRIDEIVEICHQYNIPVIEDAAESIGSFYKNQHTGTFGDLGILSFNGNKTITTGGGGMILVSDQPSARGWTSAHDPAHSQPLAILARHLSTQAKVGHPWEFRHDAIGYNYRMPNINAALGLAQLEGLPVILKSKQKLWEEYSAFFDGLNIPSIKEIPGSESNHWLNGFFCESKEERDAFLQFSHDQKIFCRPAWNLLPSLPMYQHCQTDGNEVAKWVEDRLVNVPSSARI